MAFSVQTDKPKCKNCPVKELDIETLYADGTVYEQIIFCKNEDICDQLEKHFKKISAAVFAPA